MPTFAMLSSVLTAFTVLPLTFADPRERGVLQHLTVLAAYTVVGALAAARVFKWE